MLFPAQLEEEDADVEVVGIHGGRVFIRAPHDRIRIYPGVRMRMDYYNALNPPALAPEDGGAKLGPRFTLRRLRFDMSGELFRRVFFTAGIELGGGRVGDTVYAGPGTSRFSMPSAHDGKLRPAEVSVSYKFRPWLNMTLGQFNVPFSMSNRTREEALPWLERDIATRGLAVPNVKDIGMSLWGDVLVGNMLTYELGIFTGDGSERPGADQLPEFIGRVYARPLRRLGSGTFFQRAQIGMSGRLGARDHRGFVTYDYPTIATNNGFVLWQPGYVDSLDRVVRVIPSGRQSALGGELRLPFDLPGGRALDFRGEAYYVDNNTREAVAGFEATNSERFGRVRSVGWYAQASFWCCGDAFVQEAPGRYRPVTVDLAHELPYKRGLEIQLLASSIFGSYSGATRQGSTSDANTPAANFSVYQLGGGIQYHHGRNFRTLLHYFAYLTPNSADAQSNQALVPANLGGSAAITHHELSARMAVTF